MVISLFPFVGGSEIGPPVLREAREGKRSRKAPKTVHLRLVAALYVGAEGENSKLTA
jgi:hypothetical protein